LAPTSNASPSGTVSPSPAAIESINGTAAPHALIVSADDIGRHLDALQSIADANNGIRAAGTSGYQASADYVADLLTQMGFAVQRVPFNFTFFDEAAPVQLTVGNQTWSGSEWLHSMLYAGQGDVAGVLQAVKLTPDGRLINTGGCDPADWADFVPGHIAVIESGPCIRRDQVLNAQNAGAIGLVSLYPNWLANETRRPTLLGPDVVTIPAIVAGGEPTSAILAALAAGASAQINVQLDQHPATNDDVIAEWPGTTNDVAMLGAHLDSVLDGPGINDNGSGVATLLSLAQSVAANRQPTKTIRFGFWAAEEYGELGSDAYVTGLSTDELVRIKTYLNIDMDASPNAARFVYDDANAPAGSDGLVRALLLALSAQGKPGLTTDLNGASDHYMFEQRDIPSAGVFSGLNPLTAADVAAFGGEQGVPADACYHLSCDTRGNINLDSAVTLGDAVASVLQGLAY
jgi:hypothetical protein